MPAAIAGVNWGAHRRLERLADGTRWRQLLRWSSPDGLPRALVLAVSQALPDADDVGGADAHGGALLQLQWGAGGAWHQAECDPNARLDLHCAEVICRARLRSDDADAWPHVDLTATVGPGPRGYRGRVLLTGDQVDVAAAASQAWPVPAFARRWTLVVTSDTVVGANRDAYVRGGPAGRVLFRARNDNVLPVSGAWGNSDRLVWIEVPGDAWGVTWTNGAGVPITIQPLWELDL